MSRIDVKQLSCPMSQACMRSGDHSHFSCDECGAVDFAGNCQTCVTMRGIAIMGMVDPPGQEPS